MSICMYVCIYTHKQTHTHKHTGVPTHVAPPVRASRAASQDEGWYKKKYYMCPHTTMYASLELLMCPAEMRPHMRAHALLCNSALKAP